MIISRNTEWATMEELVKEDFNDTLGIYELEDIKLCNTSEVYLEEEWIPNELIPDELIGADTDNLTDEQENLWVKIRATYIEEYVDIWNKLLSDRLEEEKNTIQKDIDKGKYDEYRDEYDEYKRDFEKKRNNYYGYIRNNSRNWRKDFSELYGDGNPSTFAEWLKDNSYIK